MKVLGIIPARAGSKRVPGKNMRKLGGKSLVERIIETALACSELDRLIVSTDSNEILSLEGNYSQGKLSFLQRPDEISGNDSPAIDYVKHTLEHLASQNEQYGIIVILQPSSPFTSSEDVDGTIKLLNDTGADTAVTVTKLPHDVNPLKMKVLEDGKLFPFIEEENGRMEQGKLPVIYVRNCSVYATRREVISEGKIIGDDCRGYIMPRERSVDINDEFDFLFAEFLNTRTELNR